MTNTVIKPANLTQATESKSLTTTQTPETTADEKTKKTSTTKAVARFIDGQKAEVPGYFTLPPLLLMSLIGAWIFWLRQPKVVVKDSQKFITALNIWHEIVIAEQQTPRSIKRFINRVRYFAMHHQPQTEHRSNFLNWLKKEKPTAAPLNTEQQMPEEILVALSAIHHTNPELLEHDLSLLSDNSPDIENPTNPDETTHNIAIYLSAISNHQEVFGQWPPSPEQLALFRKISAGIYVH